MILYYEGFTIQISKVIVRHRLAYQPHISICGDKQNSFFESYYSWHDFSFGKCLYEAMRIVDQIIYDYQSKPDFYEPEDLSKALNMVVTSSVAAVF
jgi:hypothetical protein